MIGPTNSTAHQQYANGVNISVIIINSLVKSICYATVLPAIAIYNSNKIDVKINVDKLLDDVNSYFQTHSWETSIIDTSRERNLSILIYNTSKIP